MFESKIIQLIFVTIMWAVLTKVFGLDFVAIHSNHLANLAVSIVLDASDFWLDKRGFLLRINENWYGIYRIHPWLVDSPLLLCGALSGFAFSLWTLIFDWSSDSVDIAKEKTTSGPHETDSPKALGEYLS